MNTKYLIQGIGIAFGFLLVCNFCNLLYEMGFYAGNISRDDHLTTIKKRSVTEGNIVKYPFKDEKVADDVTHSDDTRPAN